jgi:anti-sigma B factor antagonist
MRAFEILETGDGGLAVVGDIDLATAPTLAEALARCGPRVELDLDGCTFLDSSGVSVIVAARTHAVPELTITKASQPVRRVLDLCGLADVLLVEQSSTTLP